MPREIHIPEEPAPEADAAYVASKEAAELEAIAQWGEWLATQSETIQALAEEWAAHRHSRFTLSERRDRRGRTVYVCDCEHGHHESLQSYEHAIFLLVDSHRVRLEDRPETAARVAGLDGVEVKAARVSVQRLAREIREANPMASGEERDGLLAAELAEMERARA